LASARIPGAKAKDAEMDLADALQKSPQEMLKMSPVEIQAAIDARIAQTQSTASAGATEENAEAMQVLQRHKEEIRCFIAARPRWLPETVYFWRYRLRTVFEDLLTEEAGTYDFQRFQVLAWTLILGTVFVVKVFYDRVMPTFDTNVLLLMGISSGAYITFKKVATDQAPPDPKKDPVKSS
jgi:hypothetical protein